MRAARVQHQDHTRERAEVNVDQHPVAKRAGAPAVNLFAQRIGHDGSDPEEPDETSDPSHRQPRSGQHSVESARRQTPDYCRNCKHNQDRADNMKSLRQRIALVNVAPESLRLVAED